jgi:hypothetical protein
MGKRCAWWCCCSWREMESQLQWLGHHLSYCRRNMYVVTLLYVFLTNVSEGCWVRKLWDSFCYDKFEYREWFSAPEGKYVINSFLFRSLLYPRIYIVVYSAMYSFPLSNLVLLVVISLVLRSIHGMPLSSNERERTASASLTSFSSIPQECFWRTGDFF